MERETVSTSCSCIYCARLRSQYDPYVKTYDELWDELDEREGVRT